MRSRAALENRVYERQGQALSVRTALHMQRLSGTPALAEAAALEAGGVFLSLPSHEFLDKDDLLSKFNTLYAELGRLSSTFKQAIADEEVDKKEKMSLEEIGQNIHRTLQELLALTFLVYCPPEEAAEGKVGRSTGCPC
jgi:hypothetical protein